MWEAVLAFISGIFFNKDKIIIYVFIMRGLVK